MSVVHRAWKDRDISTFSNVKSSQVENGLNCPAWSTEARPGLFWLSGLRVTESKISRTTTYLKYSPDRGSYSTEYVPSYHGLL